MSRNLLSKTLKEALPINIGRSYAFFYNSKLVIFLVLTSLKPPPTGKSMCEPFSLGSMSWFTQTKCIACNCWPLVHLLLQHKDYLTNELIHAVIMSRLTAYFLIAMAVILASGAEGRHNYPNGKKLKRFFDKYPELKKGIKAVLKTASAPSGRKEESDVCFEVGKGSYCNSVGFKNDGGKSNYNKKSLKRFFDEYSNLKKGI